MTPRAARSPILVAPVAAACGGSSGGAPTTGASATAAPTVPGATPAPVATGPSTLVAPVATTGPSPSTVRCPTAATVGSALGITVSQPVAVPGGGGTPLPAGTTGVSCDHRAAAASVLIEVRRF
jgi:hypothetical protein